MSAVVYDVGYNTRMIKTRNLTAINEKQFHKA